MSFVIFLLAFHKKLSKVVKKANKQKKRTVKAITQQKTLPSVH